MPKNRHIELAAQVGDEADVSSGKAANALVHAKAYALAVPPAAIPSHARPSAWRRRAWWLGLVIAAAGGGWLFLAQPWSAGMPLVVVEVVAAGPVTRVLAVNGRIAALHSIDVKSNVAGTLVAPLAEEGDLVEQGAVLARLDDTAQQAAVRQANAALDQGLGTQRQAREALLRAESLASTISRVTLDDARRAVEMADQEIDRLRAVVDQSQFQLTRYSIAAPMAGTILTRGVEPGQVVDLSTRLFSLADLRELVVETDIDESYATQVRPGMSALLQLTGDPRILDGAVSFVAPIVDAATGGLAVKIAFSEPQQAPVGLTVTANIVVDRREAAISAPRSAIDRSGTVPAVFVLDGDHARRTPVSIIDWPADRLIVTDGLRQGDALIVDAAELIDGQEVKVADR